MFLRQLLSLATKSQRLNLLYTPAPAGIGSGTTPTEDNMQRRLTDAERRQAQQAYSGLYNLHVYVDGRVELAEKLLAMLEHDTTDGRPYVEPPLTDEDARARPWVMCRGQDDQEWYGPYVLACKTNEIFGFVVALPDFSELTFWCDCRRATPAEIAAAGLEVTK
jgi:hypothetical protein